MNVISLGSTLLQLRLDLHILRRVFGARCLSEATRFSGPDPSSENTGGRVAPTGPLIRRLSAIINPLPAVVLSPPPQPVDGEW